MAGYVTFGGFGLSLLDERFGMDLYAPALPALLLLTVAVAVDSYRVQADQLLMGTKHVRIVVNGEALKLLLLVALIPVG